MIHYHGFVEGLASCSADQYRSRLPVIVVASEAIQSMVGGLVWCALRCRTSDRRISRIQ